MVRTHKDVASSSNPSKKRRYNPTTRPTRKTDPLNRPITGRWDAYDSKFLSDMRPVKLLPCRLGCESTLQELGLKEDVEAMFENIGFGRIWKINEPFYPRLVKEFLATCRLTYTDPDRPRASEGTLTFFLNKQHYSYTLFEVCDIFGFEKGEEVKFPAFGKREADEFWDIIASGRYISRAAKISMMRNPVLRVVVKLISNTFFWKKESGSVREDELWMLYYGVKHLIPRYANMAGPAVNFAAMLCERLVKIKKSPPRQLLLSNILTPIFKHTGINLTEEDVEDKWDSVDIEYLIHCKVLYKRDIYQFYGRDGVARWCQLPNRGITSILDASSLEFNVGPEDLVTDQALPRRRTGTRQPRRARRPQVAEESATSDDEIQEEEEEEDEPQPRYLLPHSPERYRLSPSPPADDTAQQLQYIIKAEKKNNSMMRKIWSAMQKIRPCSCASGSRTRGDESEEESSDDIHETRTKYIHDQYIPHTRDQPGTTDLRAPDSRLNIGRRESSSESHRN